MWIWVRFKWSRKSGPWPRSWTCSFFHVPITGVERAIEKPQYVGRSTVFFISLPKKLSFFFIFSFCRSDCTISQRFIWIHCYSLTCHTWMQLECRVISVFALILGSHIPFTSSINLAFTIHYYLRDMHSQYYRSICCSYPCFFSYSLQGWLL